MAMLEWKDNYTVSIERFDEAHRHLIGLINKLQDNIEQNKSRDVLESVLNELKSYTLSHFSEEEKLMEDNNYPNLSEHQQEHAKFIKEINVIEEKLNKNSNLLNIQLMYFLNNWLINHILSTDQKYVPYCTGNKNK